MDTVNTCNLDLGKPVIYLHWCSGIITIKKERGWLKLYKYFVCGRDINIQTFIFVASNSKDKGKYNIIGLLNWYRWILARVAIGCGLFRRGRLEGVHTGIRSLWGGISSMSSSQFRTIAQLSVWNSGNCQRSWRF